jgi:hypothetical protein
MPESFVLNAMKQAKFTEEDISNLRMRRFLQRALPGGSIKGLKAYIAGLLPPPPDRRQRKPPTTAASPKDEVADRHQRKPPPNLTVDPAATAALFEEVTVIDSGETVLSSLSPGTAATKRKVKHKRWDHNFYINKKNKRMVGLPSPAVTTTTMMTTTTTSTTTSMATAAAPDMDPWAVSSSGKVGSRAAKKMAKQRHVKPSVDKILNAGNVQLQSALLHALADHPALTPAVKLVKWLSEPYTLQEETVGMASLIGTGKMVAKAVCFNRVQRAPYWYTLSGEHTIVEVRHVLRTGLHLQLISVANKLPQACNRMEATRQKAIKVTHLDHDAIMEEASRRDRLEYDDDEDNESKEEESDGKLAVI